MNVKVNQSSSQKTNPQNQNNVNNPQPQSQNINILELQKQIEYLQQQLQQLQKQQNQNVDNKTINTLQNDEFVVKTTMKSSAVAARLENLLLGGKRKIIITALGYAIPIAIDVTMLIRKDLNRVGKSVNIDNIELFEREVVSEEVSRKLKKKKIISGIKITLSI